MDKIRTDIKAAVRNAVVHYNHYTQLIRCSLPVVIMQTSRKWSLL